ncbi:MAG: alpha-amylase family glycosyl hydrolase [Bacteroidota bacterium]|nr:alpha-amylase family glycosyl hydrolase [Bacteroidota bacterium]
MINHALNINLSKYPSATGGLQQSKNIFPQFEFHILASARKKYQVDQSLFTSSGNVIFPNYHSVRLLAQKMNAQRDLQKHPEQSIRAGQLNAMGLIDEIYHYVLRLYEETANPKVFERTIKKMGQTVKTDKLNETLHQFGKLFPPLEVYLGEKTFKDYLNSTTGNKPHAEVMLEEIILLYFSNFNPANIQFIELFDDKDLKERAAYSQLIREAEKFFQTEKQFGPQNQFIFDLLKAPILASPNSLSGQLEYIKKNWGLILSDKFLKKILSAGDLFKEDMRIIFHGEVPSPPVPSYKYHELVDAGLLDLERFTSDLDWMPNVVLLAKNIYVWLAQLSKKYKRPITKLNEIPDEELDLLKQWNFTALWLIGIWERSSASQKIKQWTGNPEAVSSAYSVYDYEIAGDLGGEEAFQNLRYRAWQKGIRLAGDMVPNHMGIFSKWIMEHPDYFIQSEYPPFPNYRFTGGNLSEYPEVELRIEDGYWNRSDAAVVFQRVDKQNGNVRYIYHGNDGTHMPWNDTAQLDFLKAEVREAVIQTIFHVARKFSIIRFDAAMTLAKRHFQRLWYPQPGSGGDIPSRSDYALSTEEFNKLFPNEFWREVVDRINQEMPNTLLLAEAFWLLEGYFVRTLGMHRVYNSAFMHMLMKEENNKYRELIKNTLHYNPEILKRYVNFMSNPDEQTAIAQFGKDDKYFGVALMMVTLPGLPMFAHGQVEGYTEKYGMEYKRAYYNEEPDVHLIWRHEQEIYPLLGKRHLFSQVANFELYDFIDNNGKPNENVLSYSNKSGNERAIICYHNKFEETSGWIKYSVGRNIASTDNPKLIHCTLAEALELSNAENVFYIFKDYKTNLEYLRSGKDLHESGLHIELKAFQYHVFLDFKEVDDLNQDYERLSKHLHGKGVPNIQEEFWTVKMFPVYLKLHDLINIDKLNVFRKLYLQPTDLSLKDENIIKTLIDKYLQFVQQVKTLMNSTLGTNDVVEHFRKKLEVVRQLSLNGWRIDKDSYSIMDFTDRLNCLIIYSWLALQSIEHAGEPKFHERLRLDKAFKDIFKSFSEDEYKINELIGLISLLLNENFFLDYNPDSIHKYFCRPDVQKFIKLNEYDRVKFYNKENYDQLIRWLFLVALVQMCSAIDEPKLSLWIRQMYPKFEKFLTLSIEVKYQFNELKAQLSQIK